MAGYYFDESGVRRIVATVRRVENQPRSTPQTDPPMVSSGTSETWLECQNNAGETIPALSVVSVGSESTLDGRKVNYALKPSTTLYPLHGFTSSRDSVAAAKLGVIMEAGFVRYDTGTPAPGEGWGIKPGQYTLSKGYPGARCIRIVDSTAKIMLAQFLPITTLLGKTTGSISAGSSATTAYKIYHSGTPGAPADAGFTTVPSAYYFVGSTIASDKWIQLDLINGVWYINPWECG